MSLLLQKQVHRRNWLPPSSCHQRDARADTLPSDVRGCDGEQAMR